MLSSYNEFYSHNSEEKKNKFYWIIICCKLIDFLNKFQGSVQQCTSSWRGKDKGALSLSVYVYMQLSIFLFIDCLQSSMNKSSAQILVTVKFGWAIWIWTNQYVVLNFKSTNQ